LLILVVVLPLLIGLEQCTELNPFQSRRITETVSGEWINIYFTVPRYPDDPSSRIGGIHDDLIGLIDQARASVDVAAYDLSLESVADALIQAQRNGVRVRLVTDGNYTDRGALIRLQAAQVPVVVRPATGWGIMHNKFVVVDDTWVWTGSWNLTENGTYRNNNNAVLIASRALAANYSAEFAELFAGQFGPSSPAETPHPLIIIQTEDRSAEIETYFAPEDRVAERLLAALSSAQTVVRFMAFQFTSEPLANALIGLVGRGVAVQGVIEARSVSDPYNQYDRLQAGGVNVWLDGNPYIMHHKVILIDDETVVLGSYNFTASAEVNNDENVLIIRDPEVAAAFLAEYGRVLQQAQTAAP